MSEVSFAREGRGFVLDTSQRLPAPLEKVFPFFAAAENLERITPPLLKFRIVTPGPIEMRTGAQIRYAISLHGFPLRWVSRIAVWDPPHRFVDEQIHGPYRRWWHEHTFRSTDDGATIVTDRVSYEVWGGSLVERLFVRPDLKKIFTHRNETLRTIFQAADLTGDNRDKSLRS